MTYREDDGDVWAEIREGKELVRQWRQPRSGSGFWGALMLGLLLSTCSAHSEFYSTHQLREICLSKSPVYRGACAGYISGWADAQDRVRSDGTIWKSCSVAEPGVMVKSLEERFLAESYSSDLAASSALSLIFKPICRGL